MASLTRGGVELLRSEALLQKGIDHGCVLLLRQACRSEPPSAVGAYNTPRVRYTWADRERLCRSLGPSSPQEGFVPH